MSLQEYFNYNINFNTSNSLILGQTTVGSIFSPGSGMLTHTVNTIGNMFMTGGNIGIGTTSPTTVLHVNGSFRTTNTATFSTSSAGASGIVINPTHSGYTNSAIYINATRSANSEFNLIDARTGNGSAQQFLVRGDGNVGIGTSSPNYTLDVTGSGRFTNNLLATFNSNTIANLFTTGGNVGIGTTNPAYTLDVSGTIRSIGSAAHVLQNTASINNPAVLTLLAPNLPTSGSTNFFTGRSLTNNNACDIQYVYVSTGSTQNSMQMGFYGQTTYNLTLSANGNVGINTTNPNGKLAISSGTTAGNLVIDTLGGSNDGYSYIGFNGYNTPAGNEARINTNKLRWRVLTDQRTTNDYFMIDTYNGTSNPCSVRIQVGTQGNIKLNTGGEARYHLYNNAGSAEWVFGQKSSTRSDFTFSKLASGIESDYLTITTGGNVGIGTTSPIYNLDVNGSLRSTGDIFVGNGTAAESITLWDIPGAAWQLSTGGYNLSIRNGTGGSTMNTRVTISSTGNVGIGTLPTDLLHISNGNLALSSDTASHKGFLIEQNSIWSGFEVEGLGGGNTGTQVINYGINSNRSKTWNSSYDGGWFRLDTRAGYPLFQWYRKTKSSGAETMMACLHSSGNFGIGTITPAHTLDVNGTIARSGVKLPRYDNGSFSGSASFSIPILFNDTQYNYAEFRVRYVTSAICNMNISASSYVNAAMNFGECALTTVKWNAQGAPVYATFSGVTSGIFADTVEMVGIDNNLIFRIVRATGTSTTGLRNHYSYDNVYCWSGIGTARGYGQGHIDNASVGGSPLQFVTFTCSTGTISGTYSTVHYY